MLGTRYRIESLLGQGGMGAVYRAYDLELDRTIALKIVRPELAASPETMQRFKQELFLASKISHKNVLRIYDLGDSGDFKFITMAFVDGKDLASLLEGAEPLSIERALNFTLQLCAALDAAHSEGVVHRDLKPQNILIDQSDRLYVSDFGLAKSLSVESSSMTRTGQLLGTPRYMSPEQAEGKNVDHRSDLYSLGLICFEMLTGETPFRGDSALQVMFQRMTAPPKNPKQVRPDLPDYLCNVILKCLAKEPEQRYQSASEILSDLETQSALAPGPAAEAAKTKINRPVVSRSWWRLLGGIGLTLAGALVLALLLIPSSRRMILRYQPRGSETARAGLQHYIAILPLRMVGDKQDADYLAGGVTDMLTAKLSNLKDVYVAPPSAVNSASKLKDPQAIARTLGVKLLLEGTIAVGSDDQVAVSVTLDDVRGKGPALFHGVFKGGRNDLLALEEQIFDRVVASLQVKQSDQERARNAQRPTQNITAYEYYMKGAKLWRESQDGKDLQRAIGLFEQAVQVDSQFALAYAGIADAERRLWDQTSDGAWTEKALRAARRAQALNNNLPEVHFTLGSIYTATGRTAEAIAELQQALNLAPNSDEVLRRLGTAYLRAGRQQEALAAYKRATDVNPYLWTNYYSLGNAYFKLGQNENALSAFQHITELDPGRAEGWGAVGAAYFQMGRWGECLSKFKKAADLSPKPFFYSNLGTAYFYLGRYDEAAAVFEKAATMAPDSASLRVNLADAYRWSGKTAKAKGTYDQAISLAYKSIQVNPRDAEALGNLAICYAKESNDNQARRFIARARSIDPKDNSLMYEEATIYALAGETSQALTSLKEALRNGYSPQQARSDPELKKLRDIAEFNRLGNELSREAAAK